MKGAVKIILSFLNIFLIEYLISCTEASNVATTNREQCRPVTQRQRKGKEYYVADIGARSWDEAWNHCITKGQSLASIESRDEEIQLKNKIEESGTNYTFLWLSGRQFGNQHFWVMAQTAYNKQEFTLVPFTFENWMPGEPDSRGGNDEDCVAFDLQHLPEEFGWHDIPCQYMDLNFVCEKYLW